MALRCKAAFPMTEEEQAAADSLELSIDELLREAVAGTRQPIVYDAALGNERIREYLVSEYILAGWIVSYHEQAANPYMEFRPHFRSLAETEPPQVIEQMRRKWQWGV